MKLKFLRPAAPAPMPRTPGDMRLYAVGDVHGRLDVLDVLLDALRADMADGPRPVLIMLGDYVDRGPAARGVLDRLIELRRDPRLETRFVRGNHDDTMLRFLLEPSLGPSWCAFGGVETLRSYGVATASQSDDVSEWEAVRDRLALVIPLDHVRFLSALEARVTYGDYFFAHAGARPGVALDEQDPQDLMWIREAFLRASGGFAKTIVHGHTPEPQAFVSDWRIGVDTGAYATGRLTAIVLEGASRRLIQAQLLGGRASVQHLVVSPPQRHRGD